MDIIQTYLQAKALSNNATASRYRTHVLRFMNGKNIESITINDCQLFFQWMKDDGYAKGTIWYAQTIVRDFLNFSGREEIAKKIKPIRFYSKGWDPLTEEEFNRIDYCIDDSVIWGLQMKLIHRFLWETGMRVKELCEFKIAQIDIRHPVSIIITAKAFKERKIRWSDKTHLLLIKFLEVRRYITSSPYLFLGRDERDRGTWADHQLGIRSVQRWLALIGRELGIVLHPHRYRHSWAVERRKKGASLSFIQEGLGHSSPVSTFRYTKYGPEWEDEAKSYL